MAAVDISALPRPDPYVGLNLCMFSLTFETSYSSNPLFGKFFRGSKYHQSVGLNFRVGFISATFISCYRDFLLRVCYIGTAALWPLSTSPRPSVCSKHFATSIPIRLYMPQIPVCSSGLIGFCMNAAEHKFQTSSNHCGDPFVILWLKRP
jgi:hypothetical protein